MLIIRFIKHCCSFLVKRFYQTISALFTIMFILGYQFTVLGCWVWASDRRRKPGDRDLLLNDRRLLFLE